MVTPRKWLLLSATLIVLAAVGSGCSFPGDSSGYKPEPTLTKAQIDQQIAAIKANTKMPDGVKQMAIQNIEKQAGTAH